MEQREMEKVDYINTRMDKNYEYITEVLSYFHDQLFITPDDVMCSEALLAIGEIAKKMLDTQIAYIDVYCTERNYAENTIRRLEEKKASLSSSLENDCNIGRSR